MKDRIFKYWNWKTIIMVIYIIVIVVVFICSPLMNKKDNRFNRDDNYQSRDRIKVISLETLEKIVSGENKNHIYVYIGRKSCPDCNRFYPKLCNIMKEQKLDIVYYSTEIDRSKQPDEMKRVLDLIGVKEVPTIVEIDGLEVMNVFDGEGFLKKLESIKS